MCVCISGDKWVGECLCTLEASPNCSEQPGTQAIHQCIRIGEHLALRNIHAHSSDPVGSYWELGASTFLSNGGRVGTTEG